MNAKSEQFTDLQRKNMEAGMKLAKMSLDNSQRIVALQVEVAKELFQDGIESARALAAAKDPQQAIALQTKYAQEAAKKMVETAQEIADINNASRAELNQLLTDQFSNGGKDMMAAFQTFFTAMPGQNANMMDTMKQAMSTATGAFEQLTQASSSAFAHAGGATKASSSKKK